MVIMELFVADIRVDVIFKQVVLDVTVVAPEQSSFDGGGGGSGSIMQILKPPFDPGILFEEYTLRKYVSPIFNPDVFKVDRPQSIEVAFERVALENN